MSEEFQGYELPKDAAEVPAGNRTAKDVGVDFSANQENLKDVASLPVPEGAAIQFPEFPEITDMRDESLSFFEKLIPNLKIMMTRDDNGKAEIIKNSFEGDPRFGGVFSDEFDLPIVVWEGQPYYVNKPGITEQDLGTFMGEIIKYLPASKFVGGAKTVAGTIGRGLASYPATETAVKATEAILTPETAGKKTTGEAVEEIGMTSALNVAFDVALPPALRGLSQAAKSGARKISEKAGEFAERTFPAFNLDSEIITQSKYPLTVGQQTAPPPQGVTPKQTEQLGREDELRQMASSGTGTAIIRGFDERQLTMIQNDAKQLTDDLGTGKLNFDDDTITASGEIKDVAQRAATRLKEKAGEQYNISRTSDVAVTPDGIADITRQVIDEVPKIITPSQILEGSVLQRELKKLRKLQKLVKNKKFRDQSLKTIHDYQKALGVAARQETDATQRMALEAMKRKLDELIYEGVDRGLMTGSQEALDQLKMATGLYKDYMKLSGKFGGRTGPERQRNKILETMSSYDMNATQLSNLLFGQNKLKFADQGGNSIPMALKTLEEVLPPDEFDTVIKSMKDAILIKAFVNRKGETTRRAIIENFEDIFKKQREVAQSIFSPEEIKRIEAFRQDVLPTLWAEQKLNPSGTGYTILGGLINRGLMSTVVDLGVASVSRVPKIGVAAREAVEESRGRSDAVEAITELVNRSSAPIITDASKAAIRTKLAEDQGEFDQISEEDLTSILNQIDAVPESAPIDMEMPLPVMQDQLFDTMPAGNLNINTAMSPTILPNPQDRELAMRLQPQGIASLG
tara:strand:- start:894 stop:3293 length:2400 start_codon:yes stop_codon:yes gene_type:complete